VLKDLGWQEASPTTPAGRPTTANAAEVPPPPPETAPTQQPKSQPAPRSSADANRWGRRDAPVAIAFGADLGCPVCAQQFHQLLEMRDLIAAGKVQVRFLLTYDNDASQAMGSLAYAAGLASEEQFLEVLQVFFAQHRDVLTPADAVQRLPESFPRAAAVAMVRAQQATITGLMTDAARLKETLGATGDPMLWFFTPGSDQPVRTFAGYTLEVLLRLAVTSLVPPSRP
jgi:hypothetical protein